MKIFVAFFVLGLIFGFLYSLNSFLATCFNNKIVQFCLDFFMMIAWAFLYFCTMLAFNKGEYRFIHSIVSIFGFFAYVLLLFKSFEKVINNIGGKLNKSVKIISKKLKFGEKSLKKLLHLHK